MTSDFGNASDSEQLSRQSESVGKKLVVIAAILLLPLALLVFLFVGNLNERVDVSKQARKGISLARAVNDMRSDLVALSDGTNDLEAFKSMIENARDWEDVLVAEGIAKEGGISYFSRSPGGGTLKEHREGIERLREAEGLAHWVSVDQTLGDHVYSVLLYKALPRFESDVERFSSTLEDTLFNVDDVEVLEGVVTHIDKLGVIGAESRTVVALVNELSADTSSNELPLLALRIEKAHSRFASEAHHLLLKRRRMTEEGGEWTISEAEVAEFKGSAGILSTVALEVSDELLSVVEDRIRVAARGIVWRRGLVWFIALLVIGLGVALGYYIVQNLVLAHGVLLARNQNLEGKIRERVAEIEKTKVEALEAVRIAEVERSRAEESMEKAVSAERSKTDFLANMSHEIRTPMNGVIGMTHLLRETELNQVQQRYLDTMTNSSETLLVLINDILDLSKIEAGSMTIEEVECDLMEVVSELTRLFAPNAHEKGIEFFGRYPGDFSRMAICDPYRLRQVISNLVNNAIKFTQMGSVELEAKVHFVAADRVLFEIFVTDSGIGIAEEAQVGLFQAFSQADASTTRKFGGTGLGLAISHRLVELMGGDLTVESELGRGSRFRFGIEMPLGGQAERRNFSGMKIGGRCGVFTRSAKTAEHFALCLEDAAQKVVPVTHWEDLEKMSGGDAFDFLFVDEEYLEKRKTTVVRKSAQQVVSLSRRNSKMDEEWRRLVGADSILLRPFETIEIREILNLKPSKSAVVKSNSKKSDGTSFEGARVMLVDDNETNRIVARELLRKFKIEATLCEGGEQALQLCMGHRFDLVFMDCMMPGMDGYETTQRMRKMRTCAETPIVALTANAMEGDREKCLDAGMSDYLAKPLRPKPLVEMLEKWLSVKESHEPVEKASVPIATSPNRLVDLSEFSEMFDNDKEVIQPLILAFKESLSENASCLSQAVIEESEVEKIRLYSHSIKGSSSGYGAVALSEAAAKLEDACRHGRVSEVKKHFPEVEDLVGKTLQALSDLGY